MLHKITLPNWFISTMLLVISPMVTVLIGIQHHTKQAIIGLTGIAGVTWGIHVYAGWSVWIILVSGYALVVCILAVLALRQPRSKKIPYD